MASSQSKKRKQNDGAKEGKSGHKRITKKTDQKMISHEEDEISSTDIFEIWHESQKSLLPVKCEFCKMVFYDITDLREHVVLHKEIPPFQCGVCEKVLTCISTLKKHILGQHPLSDLSHKVLEGDYSQPKSFPCKSCGSKMESFNDLQSHIVNKHMQVFKRSAKDTQLTEENKKSANDTQLTEENKKSANDTQLTEENKKSANDTQLTEENKKSAYDTQLTEENKKSANDTQLTEENKKSANDTQLTEENKKSANDTQLTEENPCQAMPTHTAHTTHAANEVLTHTDRQDEEGQLPSKKKRIYLNRTCEYCDKTMSSNNYSRHLKTHGDDALQKYKQEKEMQEPMKEKPTGQMFTCEYCDKTIYSRRRLTRHLKTHKPKELKEQKHTERQETQLSKEKPQGRMRTCEYCNKTMDKSNLLRHLKTHRLSAQAKRELYEKEKRTCEVCGKEMHQSHLSNHMRTHSANQFLCHICGITLSLPKNLRRHLFLHGDECPYVCDYCGVRKKTKVSLKRHKIVHQDIRPFRCQYCGKGKTCKYDLELHEKQHRGEPSFRCPHCRISFLTHYSLKKHLASEHKPNDGNRKEEDKTNHRIPEAAGKYKTQQKSLENPKPNKPSRNMKGIKEYGVKSKESFDSGCIDSQDTKSFEDTESEDSDFMVYADDSDDSPEDEVNTATEEVWIPTKQRKVQTGRLDTIESISRHLPTSPTDHVSKSDDSHLKEATSSNKVGDGVQSTENTFSFKQELGLDALDVYLKQQQRLDVSEAFDIPFMTMKPSSLN